MPKGLAFFLRRKGSKMARKFFYDTEFIEYPGCIDLISIGVVSEYGQTFYAISNEFDETKASDWVKGNVLAKLPPRTNSAWMSRHKIRNYLLDFLMPTKQNPIDLWAYYADYDHVVLCWLFGVMVGLPEGMPMYTRDIKQLCDSLGNPSLPQQGKGEHNALDDAIWNKKAFEFLGTRCNLQDIAGQWANDTFGKTQTTTGIINHLIEEVMELAESDEPSEAADCLLLLFQHAHETGYNLIEEARKKHEINTKRKWGQPDEHGVIKHISNPQPEKGK